MTRRRIKSADSSVPVNRTIGQIEKMLTAYGCARFGYERDMKTGNGLVRFVVSDNPDDDPRVPVALKVDVENVRRALLREGYKLKEGQAERVAWRNLCLWIDAACSSAVIGLRPMSEAFFADIIVTNGDGNDTRLIDNLKAIGEAPDVLYLSSGGGEAR